MMGKAKNGIKFLGIILFGFILLQYQNCGPKSSGSLMIGSTVGNSLTNTPPTATLSVQIAGVPTSNINTNAFLASPLTMVFDSGKIGTPPYNISWLVTLANGSTATGVDFSQCVLNSNQCNLKFSQAGSYNVLLNVVDSKGLSSQASASINVGAGNTGGGTACSSSLGYLDAVSVSSECTLVAAGWAWHNINLQNTLVKVEVSTLGMQSVATTISQVRDDVNGVYSCIPKAPAGKPGFIIQIPGVYSDFAVIQIKAKIMESNGTTVHKDLNTLSIDLSQVNPNCVINQAPPCERPWEQICPAIQ